MKQTTQTENESFYASALPAFLEYIKSHGTPVSSIEVASSLDGITSLPARMLLGGVEKNVLVPLTLLCKNVDSYISAAQSATSEAKAAAVNAEAAAKSVTDAIKDITAEKAAALDAAASANKAAAAADASREAIEANEEERKKDELSRAAAEKSREEAEVKRESDTTEAVKEAVLATTSANTAANDASAAAQEAIRAATLANEETQNLSTLKKECSNMTEAAKSASQEAIEKIAQMEDAMSDLAEGGSISPVKLELDYPESISIKNKVVRKIDAKLLPSYIEQNIIFQHSDGTSLRCNPDGELTVKEEGETTFYVIPTQKTQLWQAVTIKVRQPRLRLTSTGKLRLNGARIRIV